MFCRDLLVIDNNDLHVSIRLKAEQLDKDECVLNEDCLKDLKQKFEQTKNACNRAQAFMSKINCERNNDAIERKARCVGVFVEDGNLKYSWEENQ